jgi:hypothetical protein
MIMITSGLTAVVLLPALVRVMEHKLFPETEKKLKKEEE